MFEEELISLLRPKKQIEGLFTSIFESQKTLSSGRDCTSRKVCSLIEAMLPAWLSFLMKEACMDASFRMLQNQKFGIKVCWNHRVCPNPARLVLARSMLPGIRLWLRSIPHRTSSDWTFMRFAICISHHGASPSARCESLEYLCRSLPAWRCDPTAVLRLVKKKERCRCTSKLSCCPCFCPSSSLHSLAAVLELTSQACFSLS